MGERVVGFSDAEPDTDPSHIQSVAQAKDIVGRMQAASAAQRAGLIDSAAASKEKEALYREIRLGPIAHLAEVGRRAAKENHELGSTFRFKPGGKSFVAIRTAARGMQSEAEAQKDVLLRHGLSLPVLERFGQLLDRFDAAITLGSTGRNAHKAATKELAALTAGLVSVVRVMDARNRLRFQDDARLLESWAGASRVFGARSGNGSATPAPNDEHAGTPDAGDAARPAA